ncbi:hypothetical protein GCM10012275_17870 [Longimycelium tulufanense]|uniref:YCII-related domain-containing protein n=1 Tax=Longimycelium tulufanense TaxID=907463 RepID=A0A8J3C798_9PSEU|nr:YciI family protein [Longimycelium tulufanense]GGM47204.1 hypothetical protein GCM10012275_17870 [Longimycelium tulufanense]
MTRFVVELAYGGRERLLAVRPAHREYCRQLAERGILLAAGPWADDTGSMLVYQVADADELRQVIDADPYTKAGVIERTTVREWKPLLGTWPTA